MPNSPTKDADNRKIDIAIAKYQLANVRNILESEAQWNRSKKQLLIEGRLGTNRRTELVEELAGMRSLS